MNQPPQPRSNALMITVVICGITIVALLVVIIIILATGNSDTSGTRPVTTPTPATIVTTTDATRLDHTAVEAGIAKVLNDSYGISNASNIRCPESMPVQVNAVYSCALKIGGENKKVSVQVTKSDGTYEVGRPS